MSDNENLRQRKLAIDAAVDKILNVLNELPEVADQITAVTIIASISVSVYAKAGNYDEQAMNALLGKHIAAILADEGRTRHAQQ